MSTRLSPFLLSFLLMFFFLFVQGRLEARTHHIVQDYEADEISGVVVDLHCGYVFFCAGNQRYIWCQREGTLAEKIQVAFLVADRLRTAKKIETSRLPQKHSRQAHGVTRGNVWYLFLDGLVVHP